MISTARLELRQYKEEDEPFFQELMTDGTVMKHVGNGPLAPVEAKKLWTRLMNSLYPDGKDTIWAVFVRQSGKYAGHASIRPRPEHPEEWEIGYILRSEDWGCGLGTEVARALVDFGFRHMGFETLFATVDDDNYASIRVLEKAGLRFLRFDYDEDGRYSVYSVSSGSVDATDRQRTIDSTRA